MSHSAIYRTEVCIIGGGIAGNYLAWLLCQRQIACIVVEEHATWGKPLQCAGIVSQKLLKLLEVPSYLILNRIKWAHIVSPDQHTLRMHGNESPVVLDRIKFDQYYGEQARNLGTTYLFSERYQYHRAISSNEVLVFTSHSRIHAKIVVGADGPFSRVAKQFHRSQSYLIATQVRVRYAQDQHTTLMNFHPTLRNLFGYVVPEGSNGICRVGVASRTNPKKRLDFFLNLLHISPENIIDRQGGIIPWGVPQRIAFQNTVLLGDAAGMVKTTTGGGIIMLLSASQLLAPTIERALRADDYSATFFHRFYERLFFRSLGKELYIHYLLRQLLNHMTNREFHTFFTAYQHSSLQEIIGRYADMDFPGRLISKLLLTPSFYQFLLKILLQIMQITPFMLILLRMWIQQFSK